MIRGKTLEKLGCFNRALTWFCNALKFDVKNIEAFDIIIKRKTIPPNAAKKLLNQLDFPLHLQWIKLYYTAKIDQMASTHEGLKNIKQQVSNEQIQLNQNINQLQTQLQIQPNNKENHQTENSNLTTTIINNNNDNNNNNNTNNNQQTTNTTNTTNVIIDNSSNNKNIRISNLISQRCDKLLKSMLICKSLDMKVIECNILSNLNLHRQCYRLSKEIMDEYPLNREILISHIMSLVELGKQSELYKICYDLIESYPSNAISWVAVGSYYYMIGRYDVSRRHLSKATRIDKYCYHAWILFAHSFACQDHSDQALQAYRSAHRYFPYSHVPLLCMGMQYLQMSDYHYAEKFLKQSLKYFDKDPITHNELGVIYYYHEQLSVLIVLVFVFLLCLKFF